MIASYLNNIILTNKNPISLEILKKDYPFYIDNTFFDFEKKMLLVENCKLIEETKKFLKVNNIYNIFHIKKELYKKLLINLLASIIIEINGITAPIEIISAIPFKILNNIKNLISFFLSLFEISKS